MNLERRRTLEGGVFLVMFCLTIPAANWMIGHVGTACLPNGGPCVLPVAPHVLAPSGVLMIGVALVLRDLVQRRLGVEFGVGAIIAGAALSAAVAPPALILASAVAFLLSEAADFAVYTPLARRRLWSTRSCSCGSPSARCSSWKARSSARPGWCCWPPR